MKIAYIDCFAGAAGDMICGALIDAGVDIKHLRESISQFDLEELKELKVEAVIRGGIGATKFTPIAKKTHTHRHLSCIKKLIESNDKLSQKVKKDAIAIFQLIAEVEAKAHSTTIEKVHFHEVGAADSIADVVCVCLGFEFLGIEKISASRLSLGGGSVKCDHGIISVPAPATAELVKGMPTCGGPIEKELLTPTAAAIIKHFVSSFGLLPEMKISSCGYGAGTLEVSEFSNATRIIIGEDCATPDLDTIALIECNIDDITGENMGDAVLELQNLDGVLDVSQNSILMKNNRMGAKLSIMAKPSCADAIIEAIFRLGITLGVQRNLIQRSKLCREFIEVDTEFGKIAVKIGKLGSDILFLKAEYSDCKKAAQAENITIREVAARAETLAKMDIQI